MIRINMKKSVSVSISILVLISQLTFYEFQVLSLSQSRLKRQAITADNFEPFAKQFQHCRDKTMKELPWMLESSREISGLREAELCASLCLADPNGCNLFLTLPHGRCLLRKYFFDFDAPITPSDMKESVKFIFESKSNTTMKNPNGVNLTSKALCGALCLILENCTYSQMYNETCITFQFNVTTDKMDILKLQAIPDTKQIPNVFGFQVRHSFWVVCSSFRCFLGERKKTSMPEFRKLSFRQRKSLRHWTNWNKYTLNNTEISQESSKWSDWSDWSSCQMSCSSFSLQNRSRICKMESSGGNKTCLLGQLQTETSKCDKTLNESALSLFTEKSTRNTEPIRPWQKKMYKEISGLKLPQHCSTHCLQESLKCNIFITLNSSKCWLGNFYSTKSNRKVYLIESIKFLFGEELNLSMVTMKVEKFPNVTPNKLCIAICLLMETCIYSSLIDQMCNVVVGDYNLEEDNTKPENELKHPTHFGMKISTHIWIICQDFYCVRGDNRDLSNSSNALTKMKGLVVKDISSSSTSSTGVNVTVGDGLLLSDDDVDAEVMIHFREYANFGKSIAETTTSTTLPPDGQWGTWGEWSNSNCVNDCGNGMRSRIRSCNVIPGGKPCDGDSTDFNSRCKNAFPRCFGACFNTHDYTMRELSTATVHDCRTACKRERWCIHFSFDVFLKLCYLKKSYNGEHIYDTRYITGIRC